MSKNNVVKLAGRDTIIDPLIELLRSGAEQLIYQAVEAELLELLAEHVERRTEEGKTGVVRNGHLPARKLQTGLGPVTVKIPKVRAKTGEPVTFRSALVPPYVRKTKSLEAALPWLYLKGISSGEMGEALKVLVGPDATGLSAGTVSRLKQVWATELAGGAVKTEVTWTKPAQIGNRRRCYGLLGCTGGSVSRDASAALLDAQNHERAELPAKVSSAESEAGTAQHLAGGDPGRCGKGL